MCLYVSWIDEDKMKLMVIYLQMILELSTFPIHNYILINQ